MKDFKVRLSRFFATGFGATCAWILLTAAAITFAGFQWKITSQGNGQVELTDGTGVSVTPAETARGMVNILVRQTAATAAGVTVWAIQNPSATKTVLVKNCKIQLSFDGTGAASQMRYEWVKATGVTTFSLGVAVTPINLRTALGAPAAVVRVLDTGLTTTGGTFVSASTMTSNRVTFSATQAAQSLVWNTGMESVQNAPIELAQNELWGLRNGPTNASVIGDTVVGYCEFSERLN